MDFKFDYNPYSVSNILNDNKHMSYEMALAIHIATKRQILRDRLKKELCNYFSKVNING